MPLRRRLVVQRSKLAASWLSSASDRCSLLILLEANSESRVCRSDVKCKSDVPYGCRVNLCTVFLCSRMWRLLVCIPKWCYTWVWVRSALCATMKVCCYAELSDSTDTRTKDLLGSVVVSDKRRYSEVGSGGTVQWVWCWVLCAQQPCWPVAYRNKYLLHSCCAANQFSFHCLVRLLFCLTLVFWQMQLY